MIPVLSPEEIRVLGVLIEKDMATPEYYPLSLNALVNGCNQKNNRDPQTNYTDAAVEETLRGLRAKQLSTMLTGAGHRVAKYGHRASETLDLNNRELAVLCVLLLRGAQTLNEIKTRTEPLYRFDGPESAESVLQAMAERGMTVLLARHAGMREPRWTHLFGGEPAMAVPLAAAAVSAMPEGATRESLADRVTRLEAEVESLKAQWAGFLKQFE